MGSHLDTKMIISMPFAAFYSAAQCARHSHFRSIAGAQRWTSNAGVQGLRESCALDILDKESKQVPPTNLIHIYKAFLYISIDFLLYN